MMVGFIISGHGHFASGIASSVELILQSLDNIEIVDFPKEDTATELKKKIHEAIEKFKNMDEIVVFTDLLSGSPFNVSVMEALENTKIQIVYGTNLGMLIECIMLRNTGAKASDIVEKAIEVGQSQIGKFDRNIKSDENDPFDD